MPGAAISPSRGEVPQQAQLQEVTDIPGVAILHLRESYLVVEPCQSVQLCCVPGERRCRLASWPCFGEQESSRALAFGGARSSTPMPTGPEPGLWVVADGIARLEPLPEAGAITGRMLRTRVEGAPAAPPETVGDERGSGYMLRGERRRRAAALREGRSVESTGARLWCVRSRAVTERDDERERGDPRWRSCNAMSRSRPRRRRP
jgi:hypothetical protein